MRSLWRSLADQHWSRVMSASQEVTDLRTVNARLVAENRRLSEMVAVMERFRVLLISMVNHCKCEAEANIRVRVNLAMEDFCALSESRVEQIQSKSTPLDPMTKADDGRDLDLRERVARLKQYVARPKMYSRVTHKTPRSSARFECSWPGCESVFRAKVDLKTHLAFRHLGEKPFGCDWPGCDKTFPVKRNLHRHRETHEGSKQYQCDWPGCEYKSWYPQGVRAHRKRHTDERPHRCQWPSCEWTFRQSHHLKAHMLKHTGEKPFQCGHAGCDQRFQSRQAMKFHCERTHDKT